MAPGGSVSTRKMATFGAMRASAPWMRARVATSFSPFERPDVIAEGVGELLQLLVGGGDVEDDVAVLHEPVRREEVLERASEIAGAKALVADGELEVGLVGDVVRAGEVREGEGCEDSTEYGDTHARERRAHRYLIVSS